MPKLLYHYYLLYQGTCEDLEKPYFRLTGLPDPNMIRPEHILKKSLIHILKKWKNFEKDYNFIIE